MSLQTIISSVQSFFYCLFESLTMRTKPKYENINNDYDETYYFNKSIPVQI